jgi:diguanylate cyclase (GGDEF)-like protein
MRRRLVGDALINMNSVWVIAAVLCLPIAWTAVTVAANLAFNAARSRQHRGRPYRVFYTGCTVLLSALAASATADAIQPHIWTLPEGGRTVAAAMIACLVAFGVNLSLVVTTIHLATPSLGFRNVFPSRDELALEGATLILGVLTAETLLGLVLLTPAILLVMLLLQRSSLVAQLEVAATTDPKTGLLNARAWQVLAERELLRSQRDLAPSAVLLLDLDFFKRVNDTVGHLGGDAALRDVADAIRRELRGYDAVARFGGEEFVVFLNDVTLEAAHAVAERTIARIRTLSVVGPSGAVELTASVGLSGYPMHGSDLTDLLQAADSALYRAKSAGRDRVEMPLLTVDTNNA